MLGVALASEEDIPDAGVEEDDDELALDQEVRIKHLIRVPC